jgi:RNA polymerase sigma-54 factor
MQLGSKQQPKQIQTIRQLLSPSMIQMMKTFQQSYMELCDDIDSYSEENVFLEVHKNDYVGLSSYQLGDDVSDYARTTEDYQDLQTHLSTQIELLYRSEHEESILKKLIGYLDDDGFIRDFKTAQKEIITEYTVSERKVMEMLRVLQRLEPEGVGARSVKECLHIQLDHMQLENEHLNKVLRHVISDHLDDLAAKKYARIAQKLGIQEDGVIAIGDYIKSNFDPNPGNAFRPSSFSEIIIPSFEVTVESGEINIVNLEREKGPKVSLSAKYLKVLADPITDTQTKAYLTEKLEFAKALIHRLETRYQATERLVQFLVHKQLLFLEKGPLFLNPLPQKDVARQLGRDPSTISRMVSSKYIYTPQGVIQLKQLCPRDHFGRTSTQLVLMFKQLVQENPHFSDAQLAKLLAKEGIKMARRTVNKYRLLAQKE